MNKEEAKLFLQARRPDGQDDDDPRIAQALELLGNDAQLRVWHEEERALDAAICAKLGQVSVPSDLGSQILAQNRERLHRRAFRNLKALAIAASITILLSIGLPLVWHSRAPATELADLRMDMERFLLKFPELEVTTGQWPEIVHWLNRNQALAPIKLPPRVQMFPGLGCREVKWRGQRLMLVCFVAQGEIVHLFVVPGIELRAPPLTPTAMFTVENGWSTANWSKGQTVYLMLTRGKMPFLKDLLEDTNRI